MEDDKLSDDEQFRLQWRNRQGKFQGIVAMKGLPYSWKSRLAELIGEWAMCPVLCIDDFLGYQNSIANAYEFSPSKARDEEEVELRYQHAFISLCIVAKRHLQPKFLGEAFGSVVIKSRLNSTFELDQLVELTHVIQFKKGQNQTFPLLIIECQMRNEFQWELRSKFFANRVKDWYRPVTWKDMEKARDDYAAQSPSFDLHLQQLLQGFVDDPPPLIRILVVDPYSDLNFTPTKKLVRDLIADGFIDAIKYLLTASNEELNNQNPYVVEFDELRRFLFDKALITASLRGRSNYLCSQGNCLFKYWGALEDNFSSCGMCEEQVSGPAYTCYFCILTLHKSCAERINFRNTLPSYTNKGILEFFYYYMKQFPENHTCQACIEQGREFSRQCGSCVFQTHLKCRLVPTIINHPCHQHFLSIQFRQHNFVCKACGNNYTAYSYGCRRCALYYHLHCASLLGELKHKHGGYEHVMKLMYTREGMEPEESYWCDSCYVDKDPNGWFYWCQECPYYGVDLHCAENYRSADIAKGDYDEDEEGAEHHLQEAFTKLCTVAKNHLCGASRLLFGCVVIKSCLNIRARKTARAYCLELFQQPFENVLGPAYTCHFCVLTLHKSCAERVGVKSLQSQDIPYFFAW